MAAARKKGGGLRVVAPLVQVKVGDRVLHLYHGDVVPEGVAQESIDHLKSLDYVAEGDAVETAED
jgi:hypothetical protein